MATGSLLRLAGSGRILQAGSSALFKQAIPATCGQFMQKNEFGLSPVVNKRIYAPKSDHEKSEKNHWMNERYLAFALYPIVPLGLAFPHPVMDTILCSAIVLHAHWHATGVTVDYIHGERLPGIVKPAVLIFSILTFGSLCYINYFDIGFANTVRMIYTQL